MEQERSPFDPLAQQTFSPELVPMYQLSEQEYQAVVNHLSNLTMAIIEHLQTQGQAALAGSIAEHASRILLDYDEDMAEVIRWGSAQRRGEDTHSA